MARSKSRSHKRRSSSRSVYRKPKRTSQSRRTKRSKSRSNVKSRSSDKVRLLHLSRSPRPEKKYRAHFSDGTHTDFGAAGMSDFTKHRDESRRQRYLKRHSRNENWRNMKSAGALSRYILWNKPTISASLADYRRRFN